MKSTELIPLYKNDRRPQFQIQLIDSNTGTAIDLSNSAYTVKMLFRQVGETTTIADIPMIKVGDGSSGTVYHAWVDSAAANVLELDDVTAGLRYEGQVVIDFDGSEQTVDTKIRFTVRERFAEVA